MAIVRAIILATPGYRILPHTAEVALDLRGRGWADFYRNAARGLRAVYRAEGRPARLKTLRLRLEGESAEETLVAWLNELIFLVSAKRWYPAEIRIGKAGPTELEAALEGGPMGSGRNRRVRVTGEVKAATFHDLAVRRSRGRWSARVVLDV